MSIWTLELFGTPTELVSFVLGGTRIKMPLWELGVVLGIFTLFIAVTFAAITHNHSHSSIWGRGFLRMLLIGPVIEEVMFRLVLVTFFGLLFDSILIGILLSALFFGAIHIYQGVSQFIAKIIIGVVWGFAFVSFGLLVVIIAHITHNTVATIWG